MTPEQIILLFTPLVVWLITEAVKWITKTISSQILLFVIVPLVSLGIGWLGQLTELTIWWQQALIGLGGIALNELLKHLKS